MLNDRGYRLGDGDEASHLEDCRECREWVEAVTGPPALGADLPLPVGLQARLRRIGEPEVATRIERLPQVPLPDRLRRRLRQIPATRAQQTRGERPPIWILKASYGVAASLLLAMLSVQAMGSPLVGQGRQQAEMVSRHLEQTIQATEQQGRQALASLDKTAHASYQQASASLQDLLDQLAARYRTIKSKVLSQPPAEAPPQGDDSSVKKEPEDGN